MPRHYYCIVENGKNICIEDIPTQSEERKAKIARAKEAVKYNKFVNSLPDDIIKNIKGFVPTALICEKVRVSKMLDFFGKVSDKWIMENLSVFETLHNREPMKRLNEAIKDKIEDEQSPEFLALPLHKREQEIRANDYHIDYQRQYLWSLRKGRKYVNAKCRHLKKQWLIADAPQQLREMAGQYYHYHRCSKGYYRTSAYGLVIERTWFNDVLDARPKIDPREN
jgi:hypothetical protein